MAQFRASRGAFLVVCRFSNNVGVHGRNELGLGQPRQRLGENLGEPGGET